MTAMIYSRTVRYLAELPEYVSLAVCPHSPHWEVYVIPIISTVYTAVQKYDCLKAQCCAAPQKWQAVGVKVEVIKNILDVLSRHPNNHILVEGQKSNNKMYSISIIPQKTWLTARLS